VWQAGGIRRHGRGGRRHRTEMRKWYGNMEGRRWQAGTGGNVGRQQAHHKKEVHTKVAAEVRGRMWRSRRTYRGDQTEDEKHRQKAEGENERRHRRRQVT